jgi:arylsulfatase A-like enzyme
MDQSGADRNVLFVVLDTVRKDHLSVYGYDRPTTPGLDAVAEEALVFEQAVAPAPWTLPVHASLFTGLYPSEHGASQETPYLDGATTLAERLSAAGYATACYTANAWVTPYTRLTAGFDDHDNFFEVLPGGFLGDSLARAWKELNDRDALRGLANRLVGVGNAAHERLAGGAHADSKTPAVVDRTIEFVESSSKPFFAFVNLMDAHLPYHPPERYREAFAPGVDPASVCQNSKEFNCGARAVDGAEWEAIRGLYDAEIRHMDAELTRLFEWLRANGEWEDTLVVVCADHGELHGEHGLYGHEFSVYDPLVNVPLLVDHSDPTVGPGRRTDQVELLDLYHTLLDYAGATAPDAESGDAVPVERTRSLFAPEYRAFGTNDGPRAVGDGSYAFVEYSRPVVELAQLERKAGDAGIALDGDSRFYSRMRAARRTDGKYVRNERIPDEAYRLDADPGERENRHGEGDPVVEATAAALEEFERRVGGRWTATPDTDGEGEGKGESEAANPLEDMSHESKQRLRHLGYYE